MCLETGIIFECSCPDRNLPDCHHSVNIGTPGFVQQRPLVNGWFTRLRRNSQGCPAWTPVPASVRVQHCPEYQQVHKEEEGPCPNYSIDYTKEQGLCQACARGHGREAAPAVYEMNQDSGSVVEKGGVSNP